MNTEPSDLLTLLVALIAMITGREVAALVGPYAAICILACAGAGVALSGVDKQMSNLEAAKYVSFRVLVAVCFTVGVAELVQQWFAWAKPRYTLMPLAFIIGWVKDYNAVAKSVAEAIAGVFKRKTDQ